MNTNQATEYITLYAYLFLKLKKYTVRHCTNSCRQVNHFPGAHKVSELFEIFAHIMSKQPILKTVMLNNNKFEIPPRYELTGMIGQGAYGIVV